MTNDCSPPYRNEWVMCLSDISLLCVSCCYYYYYDYCNYFKNQPSPSESTGGAALLGCGLNSCLFKPILDGSLGLAVPLSSCGVLEGLSRACGCAKMSHLRLHHNVTQNLSVWEELEGGNCWFKPSHFAGSWLGLSMLCNNVFFITKTTQL